MTTHTTSTVMRVPRFLAQGIIKFVEEPIPELGFGYLLIQIKASALCGSERGQLTNGSAVTLARATPPAGLAMPCALCSRIATRSPNSSRTNFLSLKRCKLLSWRMPNQTRYARS